MKKYPLFFLCFFVLLSPVVSWADSKLYRVVVFGDSITSGYQLQEQDAFAARLKKRIHAAGYDKVEVLNLGNIGATTASATTEVQKLGDYTPDVIIIELGFNDAKRGVIASAVKFNLNTIIDAAKKTGSYVILAGVEPPATVSDEYRAEFAEIFTSLATSHSVALYPNILEGISSDPSFTLADGMHPNTIGVEHMVDTIFPAVDTGLRWRYEVYQHELKYKKSQDFTLP